MNEASERDRLFRNIGDSPVAMVVSNPLKSDNPLELANPAFCRLTGYSEQEATGRNCRFLAGERTDPAAANRLRAAIAARRPVLVELLNYRRDGTVFRNGVMIAPLFDEDGEIAWFLGSQVDLGPAESSLEGRQARSAARVAALAPRQRQVLAGMARGLLNKQIAWELKIGEKTVKMHRALALERLGVTTSAEAIRIAIEAGF